MKSTLILALAFMLTINAAVAQTLDIEKTYEVSKEAMKGFIHSVENDEAKQQLSFIYRVRAKRNQAKFITYTFDYNFNMLNTSEDIVDFEKEIPSKYKPKKYRGEAYEVEGLYVEPNMMGTLVVKRKVTRFNWNWLRMAYSWNVSVEGKLKAKTDDDKKLFYHSHIENLNDGTAMILAGEKGSPKNGPFNHMMNFHIMKYDVNLTKLADVTVNFEAPQAVVKTFGYPEDGSEDKTDMIVVFAPTKAKGYVGPKIWSKTPNEYTYVRVSYDGKLLDKVTFQSPGSIWRMDDFVIGKDGAVYLYGPANDDPEDYFISQLEINGDKQRWPRFQLAKLDKGKLEFVSATTMDDFKAKLKAQPDGKKGDSYSGRRIAFTGAVISPSNEIILSGQNYGMNRNEKGQIVGREYEDLVMFHFDATGKLISQYTMNKKQKSYDADYQFFEFSSDKKYMYWTYFDNIGTRTVKELDIVLEKPLGVPKIGKIDLSTGSFEKYSEFGKGENFVHYNTLNYLKLTNTNQVCFLGENKKGSVLWFVRANLDK
jgi:hypothetical protein